MQINTELGIRVVRRTIVFFRWVAARRGLLPERAPHLVVGEAGEFEAMCHLTRNGYRVVARRWHEGPTPGDIDLVAWKGELLCFVEVKTRTTVGMAAPEVSVDAHKRRTLRRLARRYLAQLPRPYMAGNRNEPVPTRFDIVTVLMPVGGKPTIRVIVDAFGWSERRRWHRR